MLARAFRDNPLNQAVLRGRTARGRIRANRAGMRATLAASREAGWVRVARADGALLGALLATPPGRWPLPPPPPLWRTRVVFIQGVRAAGRWGEAFDTLAAHHPVERHWYLGTLGIDPPHQGRGVGQQLLAAFLERADSDGTPSWLETDREANVGFYERAGFAVAGQVSVFETPIWLMRRP